jgi:hypothetical protein
MSNIRRAFLAMSVVLVAVGCTSAAPTPSPSPTPALSPSPAPSLTPGNGSVVVTFQVVGERYRILLTDPADIAIAEKLLAGEEAPRIPNGLIVRGETSVNEGWSWSIDPESVEFADMTTEVCDGLPSYVEDGSLTSDHFCPWSAEVISIAR